MTPYYECPGVQIYHGDSRELLPYMAPAGLVLTDPPYGIGEAAGKNASRGELAPARDYGVSDWDDHPIDDDLMEAVVAAGRRACVWGGNYYSLGPSPAWLVWDKANGASDFADCELAWTNYGTAARLYRHRWNGMLRKHREPRDHPTQKPVALMAWCIDRCPERPRSILDPFMGSGTTLRAALDAGIPCVGIEREERYCDLAASRLAQLPLLVAE